MRRLEVQPWEPARESYSPVQAGRLSDVVSHLVGASDEGERGDHTSASSRLRLHRPRVFLLAGGVFALFVLLAACAPKVLSGVLPLRHALRPLAADAVPVAGKHAWKGICYAPVPLKRMGQTIPDDDFMSKDTRALWGPQGRGDLGVIAALGANAVRLYGNDPRLSHTEFLLEAEAQNLEVVAGLSDYPYIQMKDSCTTTNFNCYTQIKDQYARNLANGFLSNFGKYNTALTTVILINEPDLKFEKGGFQALPGNPKTFCKAIISAFDALLDAEKEAYVRGPVPNITVAFSSGPCKECGHPEWPAVGQMLELRRAMRNASSVGYTPKNDVWAAYQERFVNSFNTQNPSIDLRPIFLDTYDANFHGVPLFIGEFHAPKTFSQKTDIEGVMSLVANESTALMGVFVFEFQVRYDKGGIETNFGIFGLGNDTAGDDFEIQWSPYKAWCLDRIEENTTAWATQACGDATLNMDVEIVGSSGEPWLKRIDHINSAGKCCANCSQAPECRAWTWVRDAGLGETPGQCWLKGGDGGTPTKAEKRDVISGVMPSTLHRQKRVYMDTIVSEAYGGPGIRPNQTCEEVA